MIKRSVSWCSREGKKCSREDVLLPVRRDDTRRAVVAGEAVDARLDQNKAVLRVLVLALLLKVLADRHGLLDEVVQILRELRGKT